MRKAMAASKAETEVNARSRSAKLRFGVRTKVTVGEQDMGIFGLPNLPAPDDLKLGDGSSREAR